MACLVSNCLSELALTVGVSLKNVCFCSNQCNNVFKFAHLARDMIERRPAGSWWLRYLKNKSRRQYSAAQYLAYFKCALPAMPDDLGPPVAREYAGFCHGADKAQEQGESEERSISAKVMNPHGLRSLCHNNCSLLFRPNGQEN